MTWCGFSQRRSKKKKEHLYRTQEFEHRCAIFQMIQLIASNTSVPRRANTPVTLASVVHELTLTGLPALCLNYLFSLDYLLRPWRLTIVIEFSPLEERASVRDPSVLRNGKENIKTYPSWPGV